MPRSSNASRHTAFAPPPWREHPSARYRHLDAALEVFSGRVDAAPAIRAVAGLVGLDFLPLRWERFDLLISRDRFFEKGIQKFIGLLQEESFKTLADSLEGYDVSLCGKMLFPNNFKQKDEE